MAAPGRPREPRPHHGKRSRRLRHTDVGVDRGGRLPERRRGPELALAPSCDADGSGERRAGRAPGDSGGRHGRHRARMGGWRRVLAERRRGRTGTLRRLEALVPTGIGAIAFRDPRHGLAIGGGGVAASRPPYWRRPTAVPAGTASGTSPLPSAAWLTTILWRSPPVGPVTPTPLPSLGARGRRGRWSPRATLAAPFRLMPRR